MEASGGRAAALQVAYLGRGFAGFQRQPGQRTVQGVLEDALAGLAGESAVVRGAGRTDAGVHAVGQVVDCRLPAGLDVPVERLPLALARRLPDDVAVVAAHAVGVDFHARFSAVSKRYRYLFWRTLVPSPLWRACALHYTGPLDMDAMAEAAVHVVGRRDCSALAGSSRPVSDATRTILDCQVRATGPWLAIDVEADGFLYRMVRTIAGTLLEIGRGAMRAADLPAVLAARRRGAAGPALPAHGLCLLAVRYPQECGVPAPPAHGWPP